MPSSTARIIVSGSISIQVCSVTERVAGAVGVGSVSHGKQEWTSPARRRRGAALHDVELIGPHLQQLFRLLAVQRRVDVARHLVVVVRHSLAAVAQHQAAPAQRDETAGAGQHHRLATVGVRLD